MTQGLVTLTKNGEVIMKIVAGSNGMMAAEFVEKIKKLGQAISISKAYEMALSTGFGAKDDLVVVTKGKQLFKGEGNPSSLYRSTFNQPKFNPRWDIGTADFVKVVPLN